MIVGSHGDATIRSFYKYVRVIFCAGVAYALVAAQPIPGRAADDIPSYDRWPEYLPSLDTPVAINTPFGKFRVPFGYLNIRGGITAADGKTPIRKGMRFQDAYSMSGFGFLFWLPDGSVVEHSPLSVNVPVFRPQEPGHLHPKDEEFVVKVDWMEKASNRERSWRWEPVRTGIKDYAGLFDELELIPSKWPGHEDSYFGAVRAINGEPIGFVLNCNRAFEICDGWMLMDVWDMALQFFMPKDSMSYAFAAARKTHELLTSWQIDAKNQ
jgi:hypothetical protein